jgi:hypothetical protein
LRARAQMGQETMGEGAAGQRLEAGQNLLRIPVVDTDTDADADADADASISGFMWLGAVLVILGYLLATTCGVLKSEAGASERRRRAAAQYAAAAAQYAANVGSGAVGSGAGKKEDTYSKKEDTYSGGGNSNDGDSYSGGQRGGYYGSGRGGGVGGGGRGGSSGYGRGGEATWDDSNPGAARRTLATTPEHAPRRNSSPRDRTYRQGVAEDHRPFPPSPPLEVSLRTGDEDVRGVTAGSSDTAGSGVAGISGARTRANSYSANSYSANSYSVRPSARQSRRSATSPGGGITMRSPGRKKNRD